MTTAAADDYTTIAQRMREIAAEREAAAEAEMQRADEPAPLDEEMAALLAAMAA